jgi:hypothetical protein
VDLFVSVLICCDYRLRASFSFIVFGVGYYYPVLNAFDLQVSVTMVGCFETDNTVLRVFALRPFISCRVAREEICVNKYILNLAVAVMTTFGLAVPLLAVAVMCDTVSRLGTVEVMLERFIEACERDGLDAGKLKQEFWQGFSLSPGEVTGCVYIVLGYESIFWSLFAFDWIADVYGSLSGGLTMLVPLLLPTLIGFVTLR